ncbi:CpaF family protein [Methylobacillus glycogenes]|uniref:CpaF family protein n=1 Tax=Methylobacillus glycogenes TaxID=406 RepID=UPI000471CC52|nr:CpaF family protein [Methylobacillus glycogenes]
MRISDSRYDIKPADQSQDTKLLLHGYLIGEIEQDRTDLLGMSRQQMFTYVNSKVYRYVAEKKLVVSAFDLERLTEEMVDELAGFGPLETLIRDETINDILVNGARDIFIERKGKLEKTSLRFIDDEHVLRVIRRILSPLGRRVDEASPTVDARLPDGSRLNVIIPPLALNGPCMSIRKFRKTPILGSDLLAYGTLNSQMLSFLTNAAERRVNTIISGGTGSGKTTMLNFMSRSIPQGERLVTIEDAAELRLVHDHVVRLETRPNNLDGVGEVSAHDLVRNALRMRPDRIILGEVRSKEVMDMLMAMNTGHEGCMSTVHANNANDALLRLETLAGLAGFQGAEITMRKMIAAAIELIVQVTRMADGKRRVTSIVEVVGIRDEQFVTNELFSYDADNEQFTHLQVTPSNPKLRGALAFS